MGSPCNVEKGREGWIVGGGEEMQGDQLGSWGRVQVGDVVGWAGEMEVGSREVGRSRAQGAGKLSGV